MRTVKAEKSAAPDCINMIVAGMTVTYLEIVLLVLDLSGSMDSDDWTPSRLRGAQDACLALIEKKAHESPQDFVGVVSFASGSRIEQRPVPVGANLQELKASVNQLRTYGSTDIGAGLAKAEVAFSGQTPLRDAIAEKGFMAWLFSGAQSSAASSAHPPAHAGAARRIVLLSDGAHNGDTAPMPIARRLVSSGVEINCIGVGGDRSSVEEGLLKQIASRGERGRPRYWFIGERVELIRKFEDLANGLRCTD